MLFIVKFLIFLGKFEIIEVEKLFIILENIFLLFFCFKLLLLFKSILVL